MSDSFSVKNFHLLNLDVRPMHKNGATSCEKFGSSKQRGKTEATSLEHTRLSGLQDILFRYNYSMRNRG
jgi:hypothetical protein